MRGDNLELPHGASPPSRGTGASREAGMLRQHHASSDWRMRGFLGNRRSGSTPKIVPTGTVKEDHTGGGGDQVSLWTRTQLPLAAGHGSGLGLRERPAATQAHGA